jgi:hypothetical protein
MRTHLIGALVDCFPSDIVKISRKRLITGPRKVKPGSLLLRRRKHLVISGNGLQIKVSLFSLKIFVEISLPIPFVSGGTIDELAGTKKTIPYYEQLKQ